MNRRRERGQALVLAAALAAALVITWLLVFNVGQLVNTKLKLNVAADAAAYSAAVWEARSLNYEAYLNRGIVANEVAIAQLVSLRSWSGYLDRLLTNTSTVSQVIPPLGRVVAALSTSWRGVDRGLQSGLPPLEVALSHWNNDALSHAQALAHQQAPIAAAELAEDVARLTVPEARVATLTRPFQAANGAAWQRYSQIERHGSGELREFIDVLAASRDGFAANRAFDAVPANPLLTAPKRGGTEIIGEYAWRGADTFALHANLLLSNVETPLGWGAAESRRHAQRQQGDHGDSRRVNPRTTRLALAAANVRDGYLGVPEVRDLRGAPTTDEARLGYVTVLELPGAAVDTADRLLGVDAIEDASGVRHSLASGLHDGRMFALGAAELYFERPEARRDGREEKPSLFSPYWQARLAARPVGGLRVLTAAGGGP